MPKLFGAFTPAAWAAAVGGGLLVLLAIGATTAIFENDYFSRMTPVRPQDYVIWVLTALLAGLLAGTWVLSRSGDHAGKAFAGGFFADVAVGCPVCNKVVVAAVGSSGALTFFAPLQLYIGIGSILLLLVALLLRTRTVAGSCPVPPASGPGPSPDTQPATGGRGATGIDPGAAR